MEIIEKDGKKYIIVYRALRPETYESKEERPQIDMKTGKMKYIAEKEEEFDDFERMKVKIPNYIFTGSKEKSNSPFIHTALNLRTVARKYVMGLERDESEEELYNIRPIGKLSKVIAIAIPIDNKIDEYDIPFGFIYDFKIETLDILPVAARNFATADKEIVIASHVSLEGNEGISFKKLDCTSIDEDCVFEMHPLLVDILDAICSIDDEKFKEEYHSIINLIGKSIIEKKREECIFSKENFDKFVENMLLKSPNINVLEKKLIQEYYSGEKNMPQFIVDLKTEIPEFSEFSEYEFICLQTQVIRDCIESCYYYDYNYGNKNDKHKIFNITEKDEFNKRYHGVLGVNSKVCEFARKLTPHMGSTITRLDLEGDRICLNEAGFVIDLYKDSINGKNANLVPYGIKVYEDSKGNITGYIIESLELNIDEKKKCLKENEIDPETGRVKIVNRRTKTKENKTIVEDTNVVYRTKTRYGFPQSLELKDLEELKDLDSFEDRLVYIKDEFENLCKNKQSDEIDEVLMKKTIENLISSYVNEIITYTCNEEPHGNFFASNIKNKKYEYNTKLIKNVFSTDNLTEIDIDIVNGMNEYMNCVFGIARQLEIDVNSIINAKVEEIKNKKIEQLAKTTKLKDSTNKVLINRSLLNYNNKLLEYNNKLKDLNESQNEINKNLKKQFNLRKGNPSGGLNYSSNKESKYEQPEIYQISAKKFKYSYSSEKNNGKYIRHTYILEGDGLHDHFIKPLQEIFEQKKKIRKDKDVLLDIGRRFDKEIKKKIENDTTIMHTELKEMGKSEDDNNERE